MVAKPNSRVLKSVRQQRRLSLDAVAAYAKIAPDRLTAFEEGSRSPSRKQVERLSAVYGVPVYAFFGSGLPNLPEVPTDFRRREPQPAKLSPRGMKALWATERISTFAFQLLHETDFQPLRTQKVSLKGRQSVRSAADQARENFDEWRGGTAQKLRLTGSDDQKFFSALRLYFEAQGGVLNVNEAPREDYLGFYAKPEGSLPTIFINRCNFSKKSQLFTLAHEYAHWLIGAEGVSDPFQLKNETEKTCNRFAAEFLAPMSRFSDLAGSIRPTERRDIADFVSAVSARSLLSKHATAIRLVEADVITQAQLRSWERIFLRFPRAEKDEEQADSEPIKADLTHAKRLSAVGHLPVYLAYRSIQERIIDKYDVLAGLRISEPILDRAFNLAARRLETALR